MSGHNKWAQIKHQKGATDQKRGALFSKLLRAISAAAKEDPDPKFNPRLRSMIEKARTHSVPQENVDRAIQKAKNAEENYDELLFEAYAPGGIALLVRAITDNRNRTVAEIKKLLHDHGGKWAEIGSVQWAFEKTEEGWRARFPQDVLRETSEQLAALIVALEAHNDVEKVWANARTQNT